VSVCVCVKEIWSFRCSLHSARSLTIPISIALCTGPSRPWSVDCPALTRCAACMPHVCTLSRACPELIVLRLLSRLLQLCALSVRRRLVPRTPSRDRSAPYRHAELRDCRVPVSHQRQCSSVCPDAECRRCFVRRGCKCVVRRLGLGLRVERWL